MGSLSLVPVSAGLLPVSELHWLWMEVLNVYPWCAGVLGCVPRQHRRHAHSGDGRR